MPVAQFASWYSATLNSGVKYICIAARVLDSLIIGEEKRTEKLVRFAQKQTQIVY